MSRHVKAHPERDPTRTANPTELDSAIADAIIAGDTTTIPCKFGERRLNHISHTLILEDDVLTELIPKDTWHLRQTQHMDAPGSTRLDSPWQYHHEQQLRQYLVKRDKYHPTPSGQWAQTALKFAGVVHPLPNQYRTSFWHASRRTLMLFDWMGHGYNQTKRSNKPASDLAPCPHCGKHDDQAHIMLECTQPSLYPIRHTARLQQNAIATALRKVHKGKLIRYFIDQFVNASWTCPSQHTRRIWLGTWTATTLQALLPTNLPLTEQMTIQERHTYRAIIRQLTDPLITAYRAMTQLQLPSHQPENTTLAPQLPPKTRRHMQLLFPTECNATVLPHMRNNTHSSTSNTFIYSNAAFSLPDAAIGILHDRYHSHL